MTTLAPVTRNAFRSLRALRDVSAVEIAGGKASALGRAMRAGLRVPDGFAITTSAFDEHLDSTGLRERIDALCRLLDQRGPTAISRAPGRGAGRRNSAGRVVAVRDWVVYEPWNGRKCIPRPYK